MSRSTEAARELFIRGLRDRLEAGAVEYGEQSFERPVAQILSEMQEELLDVAGWAFIGWTRLQRLRAACVANAVRQVIADGARYADIDAVSAVLEQSGMTKPAVDNAIDYALTIGTVEVRDAESGLLTLPAGGA